MWSRRAANTSSVSVDASIGSCSTSSRSCSASGVPPGSRVQTTRVAARAQPLGERLDVGRLAGAVDAFEGDEVGRVTASPILRWYRFTARLWSASVSLNSLLPSPRATK